MTLQSGHAVYSHSTAEALTLLTDDAYFPGGLGKFTVNANSRFLRLEKGPSTEVSPFRSSKDDTSFRVRIVEI